MINTDKKTILGWNFLTNWLSGIALIYDFVDLVRILKIVEWDGFLTEILYSLIFHALHLPTTIKMVFLFVINLFSNKI